jgi:acyl carrier protein
MQNNAAIDTKIFPLIQNSDKDPIDYMVRDVLSEKLGIDIQLIQPDSSIDDDLNIDSLDFTEIIMEIEKKFRIKITDEESEKFRTVAQITSFIKRKI